MIDTELASATAWVVAGLGVGLAYFATLQRTVELYGAGGALLVPIALTLGRIVGAILFLGFAARFAALPLLAAFLGFVFARSLALRAVRRTV